MDSALWQIIITRAVVYLDRQFPTRKGLSSYIVQSIGAFSNNTNAFNPAIT